MKTWVLVVTAAASAMCTFLSSAPFGFGVAAIASPTLLILIAMHAKKTRSALLYVFLTQIPLWLVLHAWVEDVAMFGWIGLGIYMSIWAPLFVLLLRKTQSIPHISLLFIAPVLWVGLECIRGIVLFDGYPWYLAGTGIVDWPMASIATVGSVWLVSFLVILIASAIATAKNVRWWTWVTLIFVCVYVSSRPWGYNTRAFGRNIIELVVIQTNVSPSNKVAWTWERQLEEVSQAIELTYKAVEDAEVLPALIIWPETMLPGSGFEVNRLDFGPWDEYFTPSWYWSVKIREVAYNLNIPILVGSQTWLDVKVIEEADYPRVEPAFKFNSAVLVFPDGTTERYDKTFLTPFGERIPYVEHFPILQNWVRDKVGVAMLFDLHAGGEPHTFTLPATTIGGDVSEISIATPICFEDTVPRVVRNLIWVNGERKVGVLINLSNDGWFGNDSSAHLQHVREARMRCIENMTPMLRAANTGISCLISTDGIVLEGLPIGESGFMPVQVHSGYDLPLSRYIGDSVAWICLIGSILLIVGSYTNGVKDKDESTT